MKKIAVAAIIAVVIGVFVPVLFVTIFFGSTLSAAGDAMIPEYNKAADYIGTGWQALLGFDTIRYENNFEDANPYDTALEFTIIYYKKYKYVPPRGDDPDSTGHWVLHKSGTLDSPGEIRRYFSLNNDSDLLDVISAMETYTQPKPYTFNISSKTIETVIEEHNFTAEQIEHIGVLITEGLLNAQFGDTIPGFFDIDGSGYFAWPLPGISIQFVTSEFGSRYHPVDKVYKTHYGIDIGCGVGTPVIAPADAVVQSAGSGTDPGKYITLRAEKEGMVFLIQLMHLDEILCTAGQIVRAGETVALSGNTGKSTGPHLHIGILCNGTYIDPLPLITPE